MIHYGGGETNAGILSLGVQGKGFCRQPVIRFGLEIYG
jgi:hypothetical protein